MYKINTPDRRIVEEQLDMLRNRIQKQVKRFLPDEQHETLKNVLKTKYLTLNVQVEKGGFTEWFLKKFQDQNYLNKLITGSMDDLLDIVSEVEQERLKRKVHKDLVYKRIKLQTYKTFFNGGKKIKAKKKDTIDDFNTILYEIFVNQGYEGEKDGSQDLLFDKTKHVRGLNLRVCPYCGRAYIYAVEENGSVVKPQIDHFLPKSKYPYLALSYFNLILVCQTCNMKGCKGEYDPMTTIGKRPFSLIYPYEYDETKARFDIVIKSSDYYDDDSIEVDVIWDSNVEKGMGMVMKLNQFYHYHNHEVANIYRQKRVLDSKAQMYYKWFGVPKAAFRPSPRLFFGFNFSDDNAGKEILYKLKKDAYEKLTK